MSVHALTESGALEALKWRQQMQPGLRTPFELSESDQSAWRSELCNRPDQRFWEIRDESEGTIAAVIGLTSIEWENGKAEMSVMAPAPGVLGVALKVLMEMAFKGMRLHSIFKEIYTCDPWEIEWNDVFYSQAPKVRVVTLPARKFWHGQYFNSTLWTIVDEP